VDRRSYLKTILVLGASSVASLSVFKWVAINKAVTKQEFIDKRDIIAELAELIIPATDTPGAKAAGVHDYIINVLVNCNPVKQQRKFYSGIEDVEKYTLKNFGQSFMEANFEKRTAVLAHFANHAGYSSRILNKINNKLLGEPFYSKLRYLTVEGYCQSQIGATQGLAYDYIPVTYEACIPILKNQKSWATK
jgi:hypothetical protein